MVRAGLAWAHLNQWKDTDIHRVNLIFGKVNCFLLLPAKGVWGEYILTCIMCWEIGKTTLYWHSPWPYYSIKRHTGFLGKQWCCWSSGGWTDVKYFFRYRFERHLLFKKDKLPSLRKLMFNIACYRKALEKINCCPAWDHFPDPERIPKNFRREHRKVVFSLVSQKHLDCIPVGTTFCTSQLNYCSWTLQGICAICCCLLLLLFPRVLLLALLFSVGKGELMFCGVWII